MAKRKYDKYIKDRTSGFGQKSSKERVYEYVNVANRQTSDIEREIAFAENISKQGSPVDVLNKARAFVDIAFRHGIEQLGEDRVLTLMGEAGDNAKIAMDRSHKVKIPASILRADIPSYLSIIEGELPKSPELARRYYALEELAVDQIEHRPTSKDERISFAGNMGELAIQLLLAKHAEEAGEGVAPVGSILSLDVSGNHSAGTWNLERRDISVFGYSGTEIDEIYKLQVKTSGDSEYVDRSRYLDSEVSLVCVDELRTPLDYDNSHIGFRRVLGDALKPAYLPTRKTELRIEMLLDMIDPPMPIDETILVPQDGLEPSRA